MITYDPFYFVKLADTMAHKSIGKYRLGAVITKRGRIVSTGYNNMQKTHPIMREYADYRYSTVTKALHAEVDACVGCDRNEFKGATMYVVRILKNGNWSLAKPCKICQRFMIDMGFKEVYYTNRDGMVEMERL